MKKNFYKNIQEREKGFTLIFAIFLSTIILTVTLSMMFILYKELVLSTVDRESQIAFFAADVGMECGEYWDFRADLNGSTTQSYFVQGVNAVPLPASLYCAGQNILTNAGPNGETAFYRDSATEKTTFYLNNIGGGPSCATVIVTKLSFTGKSKIESHGYNRCLASDPRRVERAIEFNY
jgi:Tfp pilus assembly protein PilX